jgi:hypothetical protein
MNPANVSGSGRLLQECSRDGIVIATGSGLQPGGGLRSEVTIVNLGVLPAAFRLSEIDASNGFASGMLGLVIDEFRVDGGGRIYLGEIGKVPSDGIDLGHFEGGESRTYRFTVLLAKDTPESEWSRSAGAVYRWTATPGVN